LKAYCLIRAQPHYRREAFVDGLRACGYPVVEVPPSRGAPGDVLVIWNRYGTNELLADRFEADGGTVLVAENGYLGHDAQGRQHYALARHGHNGSGQWTAGGPERWQALGLALQPWRMAGDHVLVCPNRTFGMKGLAMPDHWAEETVAELRRYTRRPIRVRKHPGNWQANPPKVSLAEDLTGAWCVVIWSSSCGVHALLAGIPVIACAPWWICKRAAGEHLHDVEAPPLEPREPTLQRLAWAQWSVDELASGEPFRRLIHADVCTA
jgi:hypothetical protein